MSSVDVRIDAPPCFQLKGGLFTLTALQLLTTDLSDFSAQLQDKIKQAPKFFQGAPVVIDCQKLQLSEGSIDLQAVLAKIREAKLYPVALRGGSSALQQQASSCQLALLPESKIDTQKGIQTAPPVARTAPVSRKPDAKVTNGSNEELETKTRLITIPVRSGQQIYARGCDLLVLAPVSHGAELLADGHIHVYAPMRGRALAGISGDKSARIFCQSLEAELVSIAGQYKLSEDMKDDPSWKSAAQISLDQHALHITPLCTTTK